MHVSRYKPSELWKKIANQFWNTRIVCLRLSNVPTIFAVPARECVVHGRESMLNHLRSLLLYIFLFVFHCFLKNVYCFSQTDISIYRHCVDIAIDSVTVPLHSPNDRHLPVVRAVQRDCQCLKNVGNSHLSHELIMQWDTRQSQSIFKPTIHKCVMPGLIPHWQSHRRPCSSLV